MRTIIFISFFGFNTVLCAQNNARIFSAGGQVFKIIADGREINSIAEASVLMENVTKDTLQLTVEFENNKTSQVVIYLLDKGKKTRNREYNYKIIPQLENARVEFAGISDPVSLPVPLVPKKAADN